MRERRAHVIGVRVAPIGGSGPPAPEHTNGPGATPGRIGACASSDSTANGYFESATAKMKQRVLLPYRRLSNESAFSFHVATLTAVQAASQSLVDARRCRRWRSAATGSRRSHGRIRVSPGAGQGLAPWWPRRLGPKLSANSFHHFHGDPK